MKIYRIKIFTIAELEKYDEYSEKWIPSEKPIGTQQILFQDAILDLEREAVINVISEGIYHLYDAIERKFIPIMEKNRK